MRASPLLDDVGLGRGSLSSGLGGLSSLGNMGPMGPIEAMEAGLDAGGSPPLEPQLQRPYSAELQKAIEAILFIAEHLRKDDEDESVSKSFVSVFNHSYSIYYMSLGGLKST